MTTTNAMLTPTSAAPNANSYADAPGGPGAVLRAEGGQTLPLIRTHLAARAGGGIARVTLEQVFRNPHQLPLTVTYQLPLPADGAVSGFSFRIGEERIIGEVDRRQAARERFEAALVEGKAAALLDQERSSVFTQKVGNIPPGVDVVCEVEVDQRLSWLPEGAWEWRFPQVVGPRYMGASGATPDADRIAVTVSDTELTTRSTLALDVEDALAAGKRPDSPSHALSSVSRGDAWAVTLAGDRGARLDRDVVVRWPVTTPEVGLALQVARPSGPAHSDRAYGLLTMVPPAASAQPTAVARDLTFLIDISGSMSGRPLDQSKRVMCALIDTLSERDRLEMIAFSSRPTLWRREPVVATRDGRREAMKWVRGLRAGGGTEMRDAILAALKPLRADAQRQIVLITDGYIGFESAIVEAIRADMPASCRLHTVGVGSAPNRSLTMPAARAGAGVELIIGIDEDAEALASRLLARTTAPLVTELHIDSDAVTDTAPQALPDLYAGTPALVSLALKPEGGPVRVRGKMADGQVYEQTIDAPAVTLGAGNQGVAALYARERVEDLETEAAATEHGSARAADGGVDSTIERLGIDFQIATRLTSWVAVSDDPVVAPGGDKHEVTMPQELPYGVDMAGLGLRPAAMSYGSMMAAPPPPAAAPSANYYVGGAAPPAPSAAPSGPPAPRSRGLRPMLERAAKSLPSIPAPSPLPAPPAQAAPEPADKLEGLSLEEASDDMMGRDFDDESVQGFDDSDSDQFDRDPFGAMRTMSAASPAAKERSRQQVSRPSDAPSDSLTPHPRTEQLRQGRPRGPLWLALLVLAIVIAALLWALIGAL